MSKHGYWVALALLLPLGIGSVACADRADDRAALEEEELDRELDLALRALDEPAFEDVAEEPDAQPEARAPQAAAPAAPQRSAPPREASQPAPRQTQPPAPQPRTVTMTVPAGTTFAVRLNETLGTDQSQPGQAFSATVTDPIVGPDGTVIIPSGALVRGRVTAVEHSSRIGETAVLKLAFETVSFGGSSYPLQATIVEANPERKTRQSAGEQAAKIGAGAAAGAILGQVLGRDRQSTLKGAAIGAAAGTAIAMGTADVDAVLPAGSRMVIRTDAPIRVERTV